MSEPTNPIPKEWILEMNELQEMVPQLGLRLLDGRICLELRDPQGGRNTGRIGWAPVDDPDMLAELGHTVAREITSIARQMCQAMKCDHVGAKLDDEAVANQAADQETEIDEVEELLAGDPWKQES